ncbi:hypothetical protein PAXRUDRAFT_21158 [Paxillus rubicundulus Ve08.2h10]|uniref:Uncharacterized protein n=1 Tax=Paxillus rubicundulus Ve08.2h10 TaxID=930991 RepID=A0A0D0BNJ3_9AGAM|nr:hypothetical protein PAXRUDRAFT_21158 [Paxillus rubicundulus Ve08.2h10]
MIWEEGRHQGSSVSLQKVVRRVVKNLTEEEWDEAENTAAKWNLDRRPPNEVKARNAARYGQKVFHKFAQEMWWACSMQVIILEGWKQEDGNTVTAIGDFNDEMVDGEKFQGGHKISAAWDKYIDTHFEPAGEPNMDDADSKEESNPKQKQKRKRADPTTQVTREDGEIWIGDLAGTLSELFAPTYHGSRSGLCLPKGSCAIQETAPWQSQSYEDFRGTSVSTIHSSPPEGAPRRCFKFHHWIDENRDLQESMEDEDDAKSQNEDSIEAPSSTSHKEQLTRGKGKGKEKNKGKAPTENAGGVQAIGNMQPSAKVAANHTEQPTRGKGKGKEKDKGKAPAENVGGVQDIGNMQPIGQVATKNAERPQLRQKGAAKPKAPAPSRQSIQSTATMQISATSQPTKMPKDKRTLKKVNPVMVPVLGSEQESNSNHDNKSHHLSQRNATPHLNNGSVMHQTSVATSSIPVDPSKNKATGVEKEAGDKAVFVPKADAIASTCRY